MAFLFILATRPRGNCGKTAIDKPQVINLVQKHAGKSDHQPSLTIKGNYLDALLERIDIPDLLSNRQNPLWR